MSECLDIISALKELEREYDIPPSLRNRIEQAIGVLQCTDPAKMRMHKVMDSLSEIEQDVNIPMMTRMALMNVLSQIEAKSVAAR